MQLRVSISVTPVLFHHCCNYYMVFILLKYTIFIVFYECFIHIFKLRVCLPTCFWICPLLQITYQFGYRHFSFSCPRRGCNLWLTQAKISLQSQKILYCALSLFSARTSDWYLESKPKHAVVSHLPEKAFSSKSTFKITKSLKTSHFMSARAVDILTRCPYIILFFLWLPSFLTFWQ